MNLAKGYESEAIFDWQTLADHLKPQEIAEFVEEFCKHYKGFDYIRKASLKKNAVEKLFSDDEEISIDQLVEKQQQNEEDQNERPFQHRMKKRKTKRPRRDLRIFAGTVTRVIQWKPVQHVVETLFEVIGVYTKSSDDDGSGTGRKFYLHDPGNLRMKCIYYEIDSPMPVIENGIWARCVGRHKANGTFVCFTVRKAHPNEEKIVAKLMTHCDFTIRCLLNTKD